MKFVLSQLSFLLDMSPPARGAWVEINSDKKPYIEFTCRPLRGGRGLKSVHSWIANNDEASPPARGAWVEILLELIHLFLLTVAPCAGGVG